MSGIDEARAVLADIRMRHIAGSADEVLTPSEAIRRAALARIAREREVARQVALLARTTRPDTEEPACVNASTH